MCGGGRWGVEGGRRILNLYTNRKGSGQITGWGKQCQCDLMLQAGELTFRSKILFQEEKG